MTDRFTRKLERTMLLHPGKTKVMLVIPYKPSEPHFKRFEERNRWTLVTFIPLGTDLFRTPAANKPFA